MKALNNSEIIKRYWYFIIYFSVLLLFTVICRWFYLITNNKCASVLIQKKDKVEFLIKKKAEISTKIDSLAMFIQILNTKQVKNDAALERAILKIKYDTMNDLEALEADGINDFILYKKVLANVEIILDAKKTLSQTIEEEEVNRKKLMECNQANAKLRNR